MASATPLNLFPFRRMTKDVMLAYEKPSRAVELIRNIYLDHIDNFYPKAKKKRMLSDAVEAIKNDEDMEDEEVEQLMGSR